MSIQSEKVKRWRRNCKERIVQSMGGACCICGYNKCYSALSLHHIDPSKKNFGLATVRANPKNWDILVLELKKCILVCQNCHSEIHEDVTKIPEIFPFFDEKFSDYKKLENKNELLTPCPVCGKLKKEYLKNCSYECAARSKYKVNWDKVDLTKELQNKSIVKLAEELGCSDGAIHKRMKKIGLK